MLEFVTKSKWRIVVICGAVLVGAWAQSELRAQRTTDATDRSAAETHVNDYHDYLDRAEGRIIIPHTGNPEIDAAYHEAFQENYRARQRRMMEEFEQKLREKQKIWQGTTAELSPHPQVTDAQRESAAPFLELFQQELPAPKVRREHFAEFFKADSRDRCVGWRLFLRQAIEVDDGWLVDVEAQVNLLGPKFAISFGTTNEIWHVSFEGELTFADGSPGEQEPARVDARP